jgi:MFS transporter, ACS family, hexuronate transporter
MVKSLRWFIVFLLFLGGGISYLDRAALSIAAPLIARDLSLDPAQLGIVFSSFFFGYAPFCFVGGWASDRIGAKNVFTLAMTVWSVFCGLTAGVFSLASLLVVRVIFGMGEGPFSATANKLVSNWFPRREQASAVGIANAGQPLGAAIAGPLVGFIAVSFSWRAAFVAVATLGLVWTVFWLLLATDRPEQHPKLSAAERAEILEAPNEAPPAEVGTLGELLRRPAILATAFAFFGYAYILYFFLSWFPSYLTMAQHLSIQRMGVVNVIPWLLGFLGLASGGFVCDYVYRRTGRALFSRKLVLVTSLIIAAVCVALAGIVTDVAGVVALMAVSVFFMYLTASTYWAIILDTVETRRVGGVGGFVHMIANCAGIAAPAMTGYLVQWSGSFSSAFILAGAIAVAGALAVAIFVREPAPLPGEALRRRAYLPAGL